MKKQLSALLPLASLFVSLLSVAPAHAAVTPLANLSSGDLIRGASMPAVYYYGKDGFRYVFPNDRTYFTWYSNFDTVKWISDADMGKIQIGGNVTYKPGVKMIKINTDPKVYAIDAGGTLRWVSTEAAAIALYGSTWNKQIDDVADAFFSNYKKNGDDIAAASDFEVAAVKSDISSINEDKDLQSPMLITLGDNGYSPATLTVEKGRAIKFVNGGMNKHSATASDLKWGSGTVEPGGSFTRYFNSVGSFDYYDSYYADTIQGMIVVQ